MSWITCTKLQKEYRTGQQVQIALKNVNIQIEHGEYIAVTGKSGSGKSTLMNQLGLIDRPTSGSICMDNKELLDYSEKKLSEIRNRLIGYIFQSFYLEPSYTVYKNVEMPLLIAGVAHSKRRALVEEAVGAVGMTGKYKQRAETLSGGEKQRICIARALVNNPELILADEPCGNLDSENSAAVMDILDRLHEQGKTIVLITHNEDDAKRAKRHIIMKDGEIVHEATL